MLITSRDIIMLCHDIQTAWHFFYKLWINRTIPWLWLPSRICDVVSHPGKTRPRTPNVPDFKVKSHTHTHPFNGPFSETTQVSRYQKGKTNLDFTEARDSEWQWHQLGHMQVCTSLQTDNHASTPPLKFFTGRMPFLPPNQQRQSTEGNFKVKSKWRK